MTRPEFRWCKVYVAFPIIKVLQPCLYVIAFGSVLGIAYQHETLCQVETLSPFDRCALL